MCLVLGLVAACREGAIEPDLAIVDRVVVEAPRTTLAVGDSVQLTATAYDVNGNELTRIPFTWSSEQPQVLTVNATGSAKGLSQGASVVRATAGEKSGSLSLTVSP
jgi:large repetitive protein